MLTHLFIVLAEVLWLVSCKLKQLVVYLQAISVQHHYYITSSYTDPTPTTILCQEKDQWKVLVNSSMAGVFGRHHIPVHLWGQEELSGV